MSVLSKNKIKWIRSLQQKKFRDEHKVFLVEGEKMVLEALQKYPESIVEFYFTEDLTPKESEKGLQINDKELKQISSLTTPNKALAIISLKYQILAPAQRDFILAIDSVQDPGNLGTIIRTADWFGIKTLICSKTTVDCFNPKVVQATMGSIFRVNIQYEDLASYLKSTNLPVYGALLDGENVYQKQTFNEGVILMGNEGKGISQELLPMITHPITIPRFGEAESLNVSVATSILLSEIRRRQIP